MTRTKRIRLAAAGGSAAWLLPVLLLVVACSPKPAAHSRFGGAATPEGTTTLAATLFPAAPPPFSDGVFPCSDCHGAEDVVDRKPHVVEFHEEIVLKHDEKNRWCLDCHDVAYRDSLHLADGRRIPFTESYRLCGQCHGPTLRNWKAGEHGKRTGSWSGAKQYLLCPSCHSPHSPRFKPLKPLPPPLRQEAIR